MQPFYIPLENEPPMAFAGLWDSRPPKRGPAVQTCSIITAESNELVSLIHNRMPVILADGDQGQRLGQKAVSVADRKALLCPIPTEEVNIRPVGRRRGRGRRRSDF
jgi:Uncharacterized conserved protein